MPEGKWKSGYAGEQYPLKEQESKRGKEKSHLSEAGDGPSPDDKKGNKNKKDEATLTEKEGDSKKTKMKNKASPKDMDLKKSKSVREAKSVMLKDAKKSKLTVRDAKDAKDVKKSKSVREAKSVTKSKWNMSTIEPEPEEPDEVSLTPSQIAEMQKQERALERRRNLHKRAWPPVTKVHIQTRPWKPPSPPVKPPPVIIDLPPLSTKRWVPPYMHARRPKRKLQRIAPEQMNQPPQYEGSKLKKIWHNFTQVDSNKMMLQGTRACNSKAYSHRHRGSHTGCIALVCCALLSDKTPAQLERQDVDDVIEAGDRFYRRCTKNMKCYKGKPSLELNQLLADLFFKDARYTLDRGAPESGVLTKPKDEMSGTSDLLELLSKDVGKEYKYILTLNRDKHFLIWGHPPEVAGGQVKTVCYIFDPYMLDEVGQRNNLYGAGAFLRYPGMTSFVLDFCLNHGTLKPGHDIPITLTKINVGAKDLVSKTPGYDVDLRLFHPHCYSEWEALNINALIDEKLHKGKYPLASLSAESVATSRKTSRKKVVNLFGVQDDKKKMYPVPPVPPEKPPPPPTADQLMSLKGEDFFLHCPRLDAHTFGRDDLHPLPKSETVVFSPVEIAASTFKSQFKRTNDEMGILRGTRHFASYRYQAFKWYTGVACCVAALAMLRKHRARTWNEDIIDETLDVGWNLFRDSLMVRRGPIRRLVLGELTDTFKMRDKDYKHKERNIAVWGKMASNNSKVFDLCRGIDYFFKESDSGILQIPGEFETAIWYEGGMYYLYHPWPADHNGKRVGLQDGGKACLLSFSRACRLVEHFLQNTRDLKRKPFSISDVGVWDLGVRQEPVNNMKPLGQSRWIVRGTIHEGDERFPEEHRNKQATPASIAAIAMATLVDPAEWTPADIDEVLVRGDILYEKTMENLEKLGINLETPARTGEENEGEEEDTAGSGVTGTLAAADVLPRFNISEYDSIETEIQDSAYTGEFNPEPGSGLKSLKDSLAAMFKDNSAAVVTSRGTSVAVWKRDNYLYFFDPHGCDENGLPSEEPLSSACLIRMKDDVRELADVIMANLPPGTDDSYNVSPVEILPSRIHPETGAPEIKPEGKAFEWLNKNTATILMGPRGENSALGKAATKCHIPEDDLAGRTIALPAIAAYAAATAAVQPPGMHQDHMFNFLEAGADYYTHHVKATGRKEITVNDLSERFEMGANTFSVQIGEATKLPLRLPDPTAEGGGDEEEEPPPVYGEGEEEPPHVEQFKEMKELLFKLWYDTTRPETVSLLLGDYHQLGVWMQAGGKVVVFDPAPTLNKGLLTPHRIQKGDELRLKRIKDEKATGEGAEEAEEEEAGGEGEEQPEPEAQFVPPEACPVLMIFNSPGEFIDKLVSKGGLSPTQAVAPYWLYPVTVTNELTSALKTKKSPAKKEDEAVEDEEQGEQLVEPLEDAALGKHFERKSRTVASMRGQLSQDEKFFMDSPNRDNQDAAMAVMGIAVHHIEPYQFWKPTLVDAILKYGDRLYTLSLPNAKKPPRLAPAEVGNEFHVTNFDVKTSVNGDVVTGEIRAPEAGPLLSLRRGLKKFFETEKFGVICAKDYCVGVWRASDNKAFVYWDPHPVGPTGKLSPASAAGIVLYSTLDELADTFKTNLENLSRPGPNKYSISSVKVTWDFAPVPQPLPFKASVSDEPYEWKVLTAFVECGRGRTILRGSKPHDIMKFSRNATVSSAPSAIVAACMTRIRQPHLWTARTVDEVMSIGCELFTKSLKNLGFEFRPGDDLLYPLQVSKSFVMGTNFVQFDLQLVCEGKLDQREPHEMTARAALESFFDSYSCGILWSQPYAVAIWRVPGAPNYYMMEPHACGPTGLRINPQCQDDGAACVMTFCSPKLMSFAYLQNMPPSERFKHDFTLYSLMVQISPILRYKGDPPLITPQPGVTEAVPATSKVDMYGKKRRAMESARKQSLGDDANKDWKQLVDAKARGDQELKGIRNSNGWMVLPDGSQFLSASHSMACKKFPSATRGNQALACSVMAVAMSAVEEVCAWSGRTLDEVLASGSQLYQDSFLHYRPRGTPVLCITQILRKFFTPGNCVCRVVVFKPRQMGAIPHDIYNQLKEFFREERAGVFVGHGGEFAVALFKTARGFYMFDPADRDQFGRAVPEALVGRSYACFSQYSSVRDLANKLKNNVPLFPKHRPERSHLTKDTSDKSDEKINDIFSSKSKKTAEKDAKAAKKDDKTNGKEDKKVTKSSQEKVSSTKELTTTTTSSQVRFSTDDSKQATKSSEPDFAIYGMKVTSLRKLNSHEK